jgi:hypothetical protein
LVVPSYVISVVLFVIGFVIIPSTGSDPSMHVRFGSYATFTEAAKRVQDSVLVVLLGSLLVGSIARVRGAQLSSAIRIMFALNGLYWGALLAIYIAGLRAAVFVRPFG